MKLHRINALLIRHVYLYKRSLPRLMDVFFWPPMDLFLWGFLSIYLEKLNIKDLNLVTFLLGAIIFWTFLQQSQVAVSVAFLEEVWEKNFLNIFITPLTLLEFLVSNLLLGLIRIILVMIVMAALAFVFYHFNIFVFGLTLLPFMANLLLFGWILGILTTGIILRYGTSAQVLAFGFIFLIQPFSAVFYPVSALPDKIQMIAYLIPSTYVFEGMRAVVAGQGLSPMNFFLALGLNLIYLALVLLFFYKMFARVKEKGLLMKLD